MPTKNSISIKVDIKEETDQYILEAEIPGVSKEDISIDVNNGFLTLSVKKQTETETNAENYIHRERNMQSMSRQFNIDTIESENISARYENGVLFVSLPKKSKELTTKRLIEIQ